MFTKTEISAKTSKNGVKRAYDLASFEKIANGNINRKKWASKTYYVVPTSNGAGLAFLGNAEAPLLYASNFSESKEAIINSISYDDKGNAVAAEKKGCVVLLKVVQPFTKR